MMTMYSNQSNQFTETKSMNGSLLERRQQAASFLQPLELPSLPPLSQLLTEKQKLEKQKSQFIKEEIPITPNTQAVTEAALAAASAVTSSMITSTTQSLIQDNSHPELYQTDFTQRLLPDIKQETILYQPKLNEITGSSGLIQPTTTDFIDTQPIFNTHPTLVNQSTFQDSLMNPLSMPPQFMERQRELSVSSNASDKVYSFVSIPVSIQKKRPRRRYDEIERLYHCTWPGCTKAYGTLNHLNAHVSMQQHGPKRHPSEFKEMRKEWRRQKKAKEAAKKSTDISIHQDQQKLYDPHLLHHQPYIFQSTTNNNNTYISNNMILGDFY